MCCSPNDYKKTEIDGTCPECGEDTVDGAAFISCSYSPIECDVCGFAPCDGSC